MMSLRLEVSHLTCDALSLIVIVRSSIGIIIG